MPPVIIPSDPAIVANPARSDDNGSNPAGSGVASAPSDPAIAAATTGRGDGCRQYSFFCGDAVDYLSRYPIQGCELVYLDPPYLMETRRSQRPLYQYEYTDADHERLLDCILDLDCYVMISGYWSEMYADRLSGWRTITFASQTRGGTTATEWLWLNYPEPDALHDYRYLGEDYRERERIKRKKTRWVNKLRRMDPLERRSILWAIQEAGLTIGHRQG